jgi:hypothetical protein
MVRRRNKKFCFLKKNIRLKEAFPQVFSYF